MAADQGGALIGEIGMGVVPYVCRMPARTKGAEYYGSVGNGRNQGCVEAYDG